MAAISVVWREPTSTARHWPRLQGLATVTWRAYMSAAAAGGQPAVYARERIGNGPWFNAKGQLIARDIADLHGDFERDRNSIRKPTALNEKGAEVKGVGDMPNEHDMMTGSDSHGRIPIGAAQVLTCNNWTSNARYQSALPRPSRPAWGRQCLVECRAHERWLQPARAREDGRRRAVLLFRRQLIATCKHDRELPTPNSQPRPTPRGRFEVVVLGVAELTLLSSI